MHIKLDVSAYRQHLLLRDATRQIKSTSKYVLNQEEEKKKHLIKRKEKQTKPTKGKKTHKKTSNADNKMLQSI